MGRTILIGDLHGCLREAELLLEKCHATAEDHVVFLGDLIDRGPDSVGCVNLAMRIEARQAKPACILGNHEEKALSYDDQANRTGKEPNIPVPTHAATRMQLKPEHYDYMRRLPLFLRFPEHNAIVVHAGVYPNRPIEAQEPRHLLHIQSIQPYDQWGNLTRNTKSVWPSRVPTNEEGWGFWTTFYTGPEFVVFGHSVLDRPLITDKVAGIDGGAVFGRDLHALILDTMQVVTVHATKDFGKGRRGTQNREIKSFLIHDGVSTFS